MATIAPADFISQWLGRVSQAAMAFESRWTMLALRRVDADLAEALYDQRNLFTEAVVTGTPRDVAEHGAAMCRGYQLAISALESADAFDDAYQIGRCPRTGAVVAIGDQKAAGNRVRELHGNSVIFISPDEVASLFGSVEALKRVGDVKQRFPGAEIVEGAVAPEGNTNVAPQKSRSA